MKPQRRFKHCKWIMLSLAILLNVFIIVYSSLPGSVTKEMARPFNNFFAQLVNSFTHKEVKTTSLQGIEINLSDQETQKYNYIPGYEINEIPLGSAKEISCSFSPKNATDKSIVYTAEPADSVELSQTGAKVSVVGMKTGECTITAKSNDGGFVSSTKVYIVETVAPVDYEISLENTSIAIGTTQTINFDIDGGVLTHDELINFRYYDTRKLFYSSSDETVATVDNYGVVYPVAIGSASISVSNGTINKKIDVSVTSGIMPALYSNLLISGSDICYGNDMILDQSSNKNHYQLTPKDGETELNPDDFVWSSSNELLVKVDKHGVVRGFRKTIIDDESAIITAKSKTTGQSATFNVTVKNQLPTKMTIMLQNDGTDTYDPQEYTAIVGNIIKIYVLYSPSTQIKTIEMVSSDETVVSCVNEGVNPTLHVLKEGTCTIRFASVVNPDLVFETKIIVVAAGAVSINNFYQFTVYIRKSLGHAAVFMLAQIFTYLTLYMFLYDKKWWFYSSISLGEGLFISGLSELIQFFAPLRDATFLDIFIDFAGVVVGAALTFLGIYIVKKIKEKKSQKETSKNN